MPSLQDTFAPQNRCFGCGPSNEKGLRIKSFVEGEEVVAEWRPEEFHQAFDGILNGGICGALLDCHSNWTAAHHLMQQSGAASPPCTVTADFHVTLKRPTPMDTTLKLRAHVVESTE
ncbi:MAG TPA: PaaI family thioesterase, partial [Thermoanaerobaculia bacterium]|nr:PaaI family thioesterase [Thermoanaerobaculia bacterium]